MGSVSKRYCARGQYCTQYKSLHAPAQLRSSSKSDLCDRCVQEHPRDVRASRANEWKTEVLGAIEAVRVERTKSEYVGKTSLWDLFTLDWDNGEAGKLSDRGECLGRLKPRTLVKLRDWLDANEGEAKHGAKTTN